MSRTHRGLVVQLCLPSGRRRDAPHLSLPHLSQPPESPDLEPEPGSSSGQPSLKSPPTLSVPTPLGSRRPPPGCTPLIPGVVGWAPRGTLVSPGLTADLLCALSDYRPPSFDFHFTGPYRHCIFYKQHLWQPCVKQACWCPHFSNHLLTSHWCPILVILAIFQTCSL